MTMPPWQTWQGRPAQPQRDQLNATTAVYECEEDVAQRLRRRIKEALRLMPAGIEATLKTETKELIERAVKIAGITPIEQAIKKRGG